MSAISMVAAPVDGLRDIARGAGAGAALRALHGALVPGGVACGPSGWALAPRDALGTIEHAVVADGRYVRADVTLAVRTTPSLERAGVVAIQVCPRAHAEPRPAPTVAAALAREASILRLGLALGLSDAVREHLARRTVGGAALLQQQLVKGQLAEATLELLAAGARLDGDGTQPAVAARVHAAITRAGRTLTRLLGASGYLLGGAGAVTHVSETIENICVAAPRAPREPAS